jgi:hypothetical protein
MDAWVRKLEEVDEEVGVFVPWELMLRCVINSYRIGREAGAYGCTEKGFARHCS